MRTLANRGDHVGVIRLVHAWRAYAPPSRASRMAEARAWYTLRLMDHAATRLREILDLEPDATDALRLLTEVGIAQGRPERARAAVDRLRAAGEPDTEELWERVHAEPQRPESNARAIERSGNPARQLLLAELFIARGSHLRATGILERLRRQDPGNRRVEELLWGLAGEFTSGRVDLDQLLGELVPGLDRRGGPEPERTEYTDSLSETGRVPAVEPPAPSGRASFPSLFRGRILELPLADDAVEATHASRAASVAEMVGGEPAGEITDMGGIVGAGAAARREDTQVLRVLGPGARPVADGTETPDPGPGGVLEDEDHHLVVLTRARTPPAVVPSTGPIEVVEKHARPGVLPPEPPSPAVVPPAPLPAAREAAPPRPTGAITALAAMVVVLGLLAWLLLGGTGTRSLAVSTRNDLVAALSTQDYPVLLGEEERLARPDARSPDQRAALAELRLAIWSDFNGDPARLRAVSAALADSSGMGARRLAFLRAAEALAREDVTGARAALGALEPEDDEERLLVARLWARTGDVSRALEQFGRMTAPDAPRYRLAYAAIMDAVGRGEEARVSVGNVLAADPGQLAARLAAIELGAEDPAGRLAEVERFLDDHPESDLPPRLAGRLNLVRARAYAALGRNSDARRAADGGLARDGTNPELLYVVAVDEAAAQRNLDALGHLGTVLEARPGDGDAQTARVLLLLELDRVEAASAAVKSLRDLEISDDLATTLDALVAVVGRQSPPPTPLGPAALATPIGGYTHALALARERSPDALAAIGAARLALTGSRDPFLVRLVPRLAALALEFTPEADVEAALAVAESEAGPDPVAHVVLGRYFEGTGRRARAAQHFDRAVVLGNETASAWYERGRFYWDAPDGQERSREAWRTYLGLGPDGPRAERVLQALGSR